MNTFFAFRDKGYQPTTAEKLRRIIMATEFVIHENNEDNSLYIQGNRTVDIVSKWI